MESDKKDLPAPKRELAVAELKLLGAFRVGPLRQTRRPINLMPREKATVAASAKLPVEASRMGQKQFVLATFMSAGAPM